MIAALLALAAAATISYGYVTDDTTALISGFLAFLLSIGLHEIPIFRRIYAAEPPAPPTDDGDLLDFSDIDWSDFDRQRAIYDRERANR